jgi:hypothetical protein
VHDGAVLSWPRLNAQARLGGLRRALKLRR